MSSSLLSSLPWPPAQPGSWQDRGAEWMLMEAVTRADLVIVKRLIANGVWVDTPGKANRTPLMVATRANQVEIAQALIEAKADVNARDDAKDTPYLYAASEGHLAILEMTLNHGARLTDTNRFGGTALTPAAHHGHVKVVRRLLQTSIDIDHINSFGWTALLEAIVLGDGSNVFQEIVGVLLEAGANRSIPDRDGVAPLEHARRRGYVAITDQLESRH